MPARVVEQSDSNYTVARKEAEMNRLATLRLIIGFLALLAVPFFLGCIESGGGDDGGSGGFYCPNCNETVTWESYGNAKFYEFGNDDWGWRLNSSCGWRIYDGHEGGYGDTLQLASCNDGVIFVWAWQTFRGLILSEGWKGQTEKGIMIGDTLDDFLYEYPTFYWNNEYGGKVYFKRENPDVTAIFKDEILVELKIGRTF